MKNKWVRLVIEIILAALVVNIGNTIGGTLGNVVTVIGGVGFVYAIVQVFQKPRRVDASSDTPPASST
jgi:hypothetical protein